MASERPDDLTAGKESPREGKGVQGTSDQAARGPEEQGNVGGESKWSGLFFFVAISFCRKYSLEEGRATHSSILAWEIPRTEESGGLSAWESYSQTRLRTHLHSERHTFGCMN